MFFLCISNASPFPGCYYLWLTDVSANNAMFYANLDFKLWVILMTKTMFPMKQFQFRSGISISLVWIFFGNELSDRTGSGGNG